MGGGFFLTRGSFDVTMKTLFRGKYLIFYVYTERAAITIIYQNSS